MDFCLGREAVYEVETSHLWDILSEVVSWGTGRMWHNFLSFSDLLLESLVSRGNWKGPLSCTEDSAVS